MAPSDGNGPETWGRLTRAEIEDWCDANGATLVDPDGETKVVAVFGDGREVEFWENGMVVLRQYRAIGGAEPGDTVERQGDRLVVSDESGVNYVSWKEFPVDRF